MEKKQKDLTAYEQRDGRDMNEVRLVVRQKILLGEARKENHIKDDPEIDEPDLHDLFEMN